jgi:hypothetical protein
MHMISFLIHTLSRSQKNQKNQTRMRVISRKQKTNENNKASKNASHLLLSYIPLPSRRMPRGIDVRQTKKREMKYRTERGKESIYTQTTSPDDSHG